MATVGTNFQDAIRDITKWIAAATSKVIELTKAGSTDEAALLLADINEVETTYLNVINSFLPTKPIEPVPSLWNLGKFVTWLARNISWLNVLVVLTSDVNPFDEAKALARAVATKWGFAVPK
jgi:hypothetical protein